MKVLSLFDGMACGALAMQAAGIEIEKYIAYEVDKYAIQTAKHNFPFIEERGDVFKADFTEYAGFDYLIGGSPCTYWSIAQTKNRETVASGMGWELFSQYVRALHESKPRFFLYENNKSMSAAIRASITETFGFEPILINSALVSAQNRQRLYWCGIRQADGTYRKADIQQPEDRGILLKDILEANAVTWLEKAYTYTTRCQGATIENTLEKHQHTMVTEPVCVAQRGRYDESGIAEPVCLRYERSEQAKKIRKQYENHEIKHGYHELSELHPRPDGKTNTLSTVQKDNMIMEPVNISKDGKAGTLRATYYKDGVRNLIANSIDKKTCVAMCVRAKIEEAIKAPIYEVKDGFITVKGKQYPIKLVDGFYIIRKLTVCECMRLQTVPEWYEWPVSKSQAYKMLGNGWTVEVIAHLLRGLK